MSGREVETQRDNPATVTSISNRRGSANGHRWLSGCSYIMIAISFSYLSYHRLWRPIDYSEITRYGMYNGCHRDLTSLCESEDALFIQEDTLETDKAATRYDLHKKRLR